MEAEIQQLRRENEVLKSRLAQITASRPEETQGLSVQAETAPQCRWEAGSHGLSSAQIARYSRQVLLPSFGLEGRTLILFRSCLFVAWKLYAARQ